MKIDVVQHILEAAGGRCVAVLGDLMLDEWIMGETSRISPEAPVPVVRFSSRMTAPGGAANVVMNLMSLGAKVSVIGVVGDDEGGRDLARELLENGAQTDGIVRDESRCTTLKTRILAQRQQMVRVDRETDSSLAEDIQHQLQQQIEKRIDEAEVLCVSDYDKGIASSGLVSWAIKLALSKGKKVSCGPKPHNLMAFEGANFTSLNEKEADLAAGFRLYDDQDVEKAGQQLREQIQCEALAITRSAKGAMLFEVDQESRSISAHEVEVFDVAGAGDTFLAAATLAILAGESYGNACELGNLAAAASVRHVGVVAMSQNDLLRVAER
ncbi:MAG: bifunctional ADP-heptose synthase [Abditibacteriaceae bacterium]